MTKFEKVIVTDEEIIGTALGWMRLWELGDKNTLDVTGHNRTATEAMAILCAYCKDALCDVFLNDTYQVARKVIGGGMVHLSIKRLDGSHEHDWRDYQKIKNELLGDECEAVELYPAESRLVDNANQFHLWGFSSPGKRWPIGWETRMVSDHFVGKSKQRPFSKTMSKKKCYIVWNPTRTEGFITDDRNDALFAADGLSPRNGSSTVGEAFRECYADGEALPMQEIELEV